MKKSVRILLTAICISTVLFILFGTGGTADVRRADGRLEIQLWYPWGGPNGDAVRAVIDAYNQQSSDTFVRAVFSPTGQATNQKLFLAIAAGMPPDVVFVPSSEVSTYAARGAIQPIDDLVRDGRVKLDDFWPASQRECTWQDRLHGLPYCVDACFGMFYNRTLLRAAGLPDRAPRTIAELDDYSKRLTIEKGGMIEQIGIVPWAMYGDDNAFFTWSLLFGGTFTPGDPPAISLRDPVVAETLTWMSGFAQQYDLRRISGLTSNFGGRDMDMFYYGKLALMPALSYVVGEIAHKAPELDYGVAPMPTRDGGDAAPRGWVGGWSLCVPRGAPHRQAAMEVIRYITATPEGSRVVGEITGFFPGYIPSPFLRTVEHDPRYAVFMDILRRSTLTRPVHPASGFMMRELSSSLQYSLYGVKTPAAALSDADIKLQIEVSRLQRMVDTMAAALKEEPRS